ncbi:hypothetical protein CC86DRAFT_404573 [Ophiobolus disseminans]|uniref:Uncharacterized protein n=1 Tax=Ophiobolus disseminans TaxID=1469910 RepID=A0A6A7A7U6_9PLEO|nr:hypothetical protein CC86DRAFT_404573 [Ophiobolus disseminans]
MCIAYFNEHRACDHRHFIGVCNCTLNCPTDRRHLFCLEDSSSCADCVLLSGEELDPDIVPVVYQPCTMDKYGNKIDPHAPEPVVEQHASTPSHVDEEVQMPHHHSAASLSDPDSETSEWRYESPAQDYYTSTPQSINTPLQTYADPYTFTPPSHPYYALPSFNNPNPHLQLTPRTAYHKTLVRGQLQHLPVRPHIVAQPPQSPVPAPGYRPIRPVRKPTRGLPRRGHVRDLSGVQRQGGPPDVGKEEEFPKLPGRKEGEGR